MFVVGVSSDLGQPLSPKLPIFSLITLCIKPQLSAKIKLSPKPTGYPTGYANSKPEADWLFAQVKASLKLIGVSVPMACSSKQIQ